MLFKVSFIFLIQIVPCVLSLDFLITECKHELICVWSSYTSYDLANYYNCYTNELTTKVLLISFFYLWFSKVRVILMLISFCLGIKLALFYYGVCFIFKIRFNFTIPNTFFSKIIFSYIKLNSLGNLIPGYLFWERLSIAINSRIHQYLLKQAFFLYNVITVVEVKPISWFKYNVSNERLNTAFDHSVSYQITGVKNAAEKSNLSKFYTCAADIYQFKLALLEGDLARQATFLARMNYFEQKVALRSQAYVFSELLKDGDANINKMSLFIKDPYNLISIKKHFTDIEELIRGKFLRANSHLVSSTQIVGYPHFKNASSINRFYLKQENSIETGFIDETLILFNHRIKESYSCLLESYHLETLALTDSLILYPSQTGIRCDNLVVKVQAADVIPCLNIIKSKYPNKNRFSFSEAQSSFPGSNITCIDLTTMHQRKLYGSSLELSETLNKSLAQKIEPLVNPSTSNILPADYCIAMEVTVFKSNVNTEMLSESLDSTIKTYDQLKGNDNKLTLKITASIIEDNWNL